MQRRPLVAFVACWAAGDSICGLWQGRAALLAFAGALLVIAAYALVSRVSPAAAAACALALALAAGERAWTDSRNVSEVEAGIADPEGKRVEAYGRLASPVTVDGDTVTFELKATRLVEEGSEEGGTGSEGQKLHERFWVRLRLAAEEEQATAKAWQRGDAVRIAGELERPATAGNFGGFDYRAYLQRQHIHWVISAKGAKAVEREASELPWRERPMRWVDEARARIGALTDSLYDGTDAGFMKGLVAGIEDDLDPQQYDAFSKLGLTHVLAISGLHVGVVVFILLRLGALLRLTRERSIELTIAAMPVYMLLTGASPSAVRACLMTMIALYLARIDRLKDGLHLLAASALVMMAWDPLVIENVSFQLSFVVTAGLILFVPTVTESLPIRRRGLRGAVAVAITAQAVSFPVSAYYFHQFHLLSLPANLMLVPFISFVVMPLGMASLALGALWRPLGMFAAEAASWCNRLTDAATDVLGSVPGMQTYWPQPSLGWVLAAYALLGATIGWQKRRLQSRKERERLAERAGSDGAPIAEGSVSVRSQPSGDETRPLHEEEPADVPYAQEGRRLRLAAAASISVCWIVWWLWGLQPSWSDPDAKVMFLDVGQGDSILIRTGGGKYGLVDAGGTVSFRKADEAWRTRRDPYEVGKKTIVPLLKQRGVRSLDVLVLTHLDQDHIGGAEAVLEAFPVRRLVFNGSIKPDRTVDRLFRLAERRNIPIYAAYEGMDWIWDRSASLRILYPEGERSGDIPIVEEQNDRSVVLLLRLYGRTFLLPGDLEARGENELMSRLQTHGPVDVLKAGHHGSHSSTTAEWLRRWEPHDAVISAGRNNLYGHPHRDVLERLASMGVDVFRTDLDGEIQYRVSPDGALSRRVKKSLMN